jgi:hypothetical protein
MKTYRLNVLFGMAVVCLLAAAVSYAGAEKEIDYLAILIQNQKVGHAVHERTVQGSKVVTTERFSMTLGRSGQAITVTSQETHFETLDGKPLGFEMSMVTSGIEQKTNGTVKNGKAKISRQIMGQAQELTVDWPKNALLSEGLRQLQESQGLTAGNSFKAVLFRPDLMTGVEASVQVEDKASVDLLGRTVELTKVKTVMSVQGQPIETVSYVDDQYKAMKTVVPMMGMTLEMVACDKSFAMRDDDIVDFLEKLSVESPVKLMNLHTIDSASYTLKPTCDKEFQLPASSSQTVELTEDNLIVTVTRIKPSADIVFPYAGRDPEALEALNPSDYLQCDNEKVIDLAKHAVGTTKDAATAATQIEAFVDGYITQKDLSVGYASAAEVAQSRQGDCSEHAVLTAAMCRAAGIPARVVCGVVYSDSFLSMQSIFGGHMWTEVYLGDEWVGLDATRSERNGFSPGHIAFAHGNGEPTDFFSLINTLGCFEIEKITLEKKKEKSKTEPEPQNGDC